MSQIRCMCFNGRIKSFQNSGHAHYSDVIECDPNYGNPMHERLTVFCVPIHKSDARVLKVIR